MAATVVKPPTYFTTKAQAGKIPQGKALRFAKGKGYYVGDPVPTPPPVGGVSSAQLAALGMTPAQLRALINSEVAAQVTPQKTQLTQAQALADANFAKQQAAVKNLTTAYAQLLSGIAPTVQGAYNTAGNAVADYGKGFSDTIQNQLNAAAPAEQSLLNVAGAPSSQSSAALGKLAAPTDALYGMGAAIPAGALAREGAAFTSAAAEQPSFAVGRGQQAAEGILGAQHTADQQYADQLRTLLATIPQLRSTAENNILDNAAKQQQINIEDRTLGLKTQNQTFDQSYKTASLKEKQNEFIARQQASAQAAADKAAMPSPSLSRVRGVLVNANGKVIPGADGQPQVLPGFKVNANGRVVKIATSSNANKIDTAVSNGINDGVAHNAEGAVVKGPDGKPIKYTPPRSAQAAANKQFSDLTKQQVTSLRATANELRFGTTYQGANPVTIDGQTYKKGDTIPAFSYSDAISFLVAHGYSRKDAIAMLNNFYPPRMRGK